MRKPPKGKSLAEVNPELAKEWHPTKNGLLTPYDVASGSGKKVWWKCPKGTDHEWQTKVQHRTKSISSGCPFCSNRKLSITNNLSAVAPEIAKDWYYIKNTPLIPKTVIGSGDKKYWWKCPNGDDHIWEAIISNRLKGTGCPVCRGIKVVDSNSLKTTHPELASEWHPTKNGLLTPYDVAAGSGKKVWWKCPKGTDHVWKAQIINRRNGTGCPVCTGNKVVGSNSLATLNPDLAKEWHPTKNGDLKPCDVISGGHKKYWWKCLKGTDHEWQTSVSHRLKGRGCPICTNNKIVSSNCLVSLNPDLAKEWHPTKNKKSPSDFGAGSHTKVWWKCPKGDDHEWQAKILERNNGNGCPVCRGIKVVDSNSLKTTHPELASEWHPTKNGLLTPYDVAAGSGKKVWWKCPKGTDHVWKAQIINRRNGTGCPVCTGNKVVGSNSLATLNPDLAKEWHPTKNGDLKPRDLTTGSTKKVWWKCNKGDDHEWQTSVVNRTRGRNCPYCTLTPQSRQELTITFELIQFFKIDPKGFKTRFQGKLWSIDIYIQELNLGIEFDGEYWHKDNHDLDKLKTEKLQEQGFKIIRIREGDMKAITEFDIISKIPFNAKVVTNDILTHIIDAYTLDNKKIIKIEKYLLKKDIQNEKGLDAYIDMLLTEKAEKNNHK
ncbi:MAG: zinc-ribbon domain-containing protein [Maribacter arcticus]|uniref:zinc-ribbon domain-containing protein n=1 Tax=Maribacter arcticus TaxID=561365 RepID=UPI0030011F65